MQGNLIIESISLALWRVYFIINPNYHLFYILSHSLSGWIDAFRSESYSGNKTMSAVTLMPTMQDNNVQLACRSYNPRLAHKYIEDLWQLQVLCKCLLLLLLSRSF